MGVRITEAAPYIPLESVEYFGNFSEYYGEWAFTFDAGLGDFMYHDSSWDWFQWESCGPRCHRYCSGDDANVHYAYLTDILAQVSSKTKFVWYQFYSRKQNGSSFPHNNWYRCKQGRNSYDGRYYYTGYKFDISKARHYGMNEPFLAMLYKKTWTGPIHKKYFQAQCTPSNGF